MLQEAKVQQTTGAARVKKQEKVEVVTGMQLSIPFKLPVQV
jgi:hypothetical protein